MADHVGQQLGNYRLLRLLGQGGFADVYLAEHLYLGTQAAIKVLQTRLMSDDVEYFRFEARTIANLEHPHIVRILDFGLESNTPYLVMSYAPNGTLRQRHRRGSRLPLAVIIPYVKQVSEALQYAHQQKLIHRDVKPENMLLGRQDEVLLSDFGIALIAQSSRYQATQEAAGTINYMAPEQIQGKPRFASDQYSLGIVVYEWLSGEHPFHGSFTEIATQHIFTPPPPLHEKVPTLPPAVEEVVMTALAKDPQQRFKSMQAFANALEQASRSEPSYFTPPGVVMPFIHAPAPSEPFNPPMLRETLPEPLSKPPTMDAPSEQLSPPRDTTIPQKQPSTYAGLVGEQSQSFSPAPPTITSPAGQLISPPVSPLPPRPPEINRRGFSRIKAGMLIGLTVIIIIVSAGLFSYFTTTHSTTTHSPTPGPSTGTITVNAVKGGTWADDVFQEPDSLIPNASFETFAAMIDYALYAPLVYGTPQGQLMPGIATEVPSVQNGGMSADLKTVTFHLRPNLVWSDGVALDARDVDYSWKLWNNPKFPAYNTVFTSAIASSVVSSDNLSITFTLKAPLVSFVSQWADGGTAPLPAHHFSSMDPASITKSADNLNPSVVSGPFMMSESNPRDHYTLVRNPKYYQAAQGLPYLDKAVFHIVPDQNTILKFLQAGTIDSAWFLDVTKASSYQSLSNYKVVADPNSYNFEALHFNFHNTVLANNPEVRKAIAMATDQQMLIDVARHGLGGQRCTDHSPLQHPGYTQGITCPQLHPDFNAANALLDQNGWVTGSDGVRTKNGQRLEFQYSTTAGNTWRSDVQTINKANFQKIGVKVDIQNYPASTLFGSILPAGKPGVYDIAEFTEPGAYDPDNAAILQCGQAGNFAYYCNPNMDALLKQEQSSGDPNVRQQAFDAIHQLELTDFPFVVEFSVPEVAIVKNGTHNYAPSAVGLGETINIWQWWCDGGKCPG